MRNGEEIGLNANDINALSPEMASKEISVKGRPGRPRFAPTPEQRATVEALSAFGIQHEHISRELGIDEKTLRKYFPDEIELGASRMIAKAAHRLFVRAMGPADDRGSMAGLIFLMKSRAHWRETSTHEHIGGDGPPIEHAIAAVDRPPVETREQWIERRRGELEALACGLGTATGATD